MMDKTSIKPEDVKFDTGDLCCGYGDYKHEGGILVVRAYSSENYGYHNTYCRPCKSVNPDTIRHCLREGVKADRITSIINSLTPSETEVF